MNNLLQNKRRLAIICSVLGILVLAVGVGLGLAAAGEGYTLTTYSMGSYVQQTVYGGNREEAAAAASSAVRSQHGRKVKTCTLNLQGIFGKSIPLHVLDIGVHAAGKGENQGDADDADRTGKGGQYGPGFFGLQVIEAQRKSSQKGHGGFPHVFMHGLFGQSAVRLKGIRVGADLSIPQVYDSGGILFGQLRIVGDHHDQAVFRYLLKQIHDLDAGGAVQGACGFVCQQNIRTVHQRARKRHRRTSGWAFCGAGCQGPPVPGL